MIITPNKGMLIGQRFVPAGESVEVDDKRGRDLITQKLAVAKSGPGPDEAATNNPPSGETSTSDTAPKKPVKETARSR